MVRFTCAGVVRTGTASNARLQEYYWSTFVKLRATLIFMLNFELFDIQTFFSNFANVQCTYIQITDFLQCLETATLPLCTYCFAVLCFTIQCVFLIEQSKCFSTQLFFTRQNILKLQWKLFYRFVTFAEELLCTQTLCKNFFLNKRLLPKKICRKISEKWIISKFVQVC